MVKLPLFFIIFTRNPGEMIQFDEYVSKWVETKQITSESCQRWYFLRPLSNGVPWFRLILFNGSFEIPIPNHLLDGAKTLVNNARFQLPTSLHWFSLIFRISFEKKHPTDSSGLSSWTNDARSLLQHFGELGEFLAPALAVDWTSTTAQLRQAAADVGAKRLLRKECCF